MEKKNIHKDHRKRVKEQYLKSGISSMPEHNILELLLFYGIPYKDTNPIAHELIEKYHDINGVLDAPVKELVKIDGIGENAAVMIKLVHDISMLYRENAVSNKVNLASSERLYNFVRMKYLGETREIVYLISLDSHGRLKHCIKVTDGTPMSAVSDNRSLIELALRFDVTNAVIAHNHPNGFATPSQADISATKTIANLFSTVNINLVDHIIVAEDEIFSFAMSKKYSSLL
jgi:DNA repair protein RadC